MDDKSYVDFLDITGASKDFVEDINNFLLISNCKRDIKIAKSGFTVARGKENFGYICLQENRN